MLMCQEFRCNGFSTRTGHLQCALPIGALYPPLLTVIFSTVQVEQSPL